MGEYLEEPLLLEDKELLLENLVDLVQAKRTFEIKKLLGELAQDLPLPLSESRSVMDDVFLRL